MTLLLRSQRPAGVVPELNFSYLSPAMHARVISCKLRSNFVGLANCGGRNHHEPLCLFDRGSDEETVTSARSIKDDSRGAEWCNNGRAVTANWQRRWGAMTEADGRWREKDRT
ncbi:hypothetical protein NL676_021905 [Syzygium grande]|nr:hypothetical protein NL676_021905 [Syzygium grande]